MKIRIIDLLNTIARGEQPPKLILFKDLQWNYNEKEKDYVNIFNEWLFDSHVISNIVNCEVEILETTITWKPDKIEKLKEEHYSASYEIINKINELIEAINER